MALGRHHTPMPAGGGIHPISSQTYGFHIALDDFGTGQSSLAHLLDLNPDTIKIDKSFVQSIETNQANQILVTTIADLSRKIGAKVTAEGVETPRQLELLAESHRCWRL